MRQVVLGALRCADLTPSDLGALELHGTGTPLGDPIEVGAALAVLSGSRTPVRLTAAKSRVGHAEPAAGAIGMLQVCRALHGACMRRRIYPTRRQWMLSSLTLQWGWSKRAES